MKEDGDKNINPNTNIDDLESIAFARAFVHSNNRNVDMPYLISNTKFDGISYRNAYFILKKDTSYTMSDIEEITAWLIKLGHIDVDNLESFVKKVLEESSNNDLLKRFVDSEHSVFDNISISTMLHLISKKSLNYLFEVDLIQPLDSELLDILNDYTVSVEYLCLKYLPSPLFHYIRKYITISVLESYRKNNS
jgi:hypothetical protein